MKIYISIVAFFLFGIASGQAQHIAFGAKGGLLVGVGAQQGKRPLLSYHGDLFFETMGKWQGDNVARRLGMVVQLGYHKRGTSYNSGFFTNALFVASDVYHNISLTTMLKGNFKLGNFLPYYGVGVRLEITADHQVFNPIDAQGVTPANFGFWLGGGIEWEPPKLPFGLFLELSVNPDITPQVFFPKGTLLSYVPFGSNTTQTRPFPEDYKIINISLEVTLGVKFLIRKKQEPTEQ